MAFHTVVLLWFCSAAVASCIQTTATKGTKAMMRKELDSKGDLIHGVGEMIKQQQKHDGDRNSRKEVNIPGAGIISHAVAAVTGVAADETLVCEKWPGSGWHNGTYVAGWTKSDRSNSPDGQKWTWRQCAKECSEFLECEFWTLQLSQAAGFGHCYLMADKGTYNDAVSDQGHEEGTKSSACEKDVATQDTDNYEASKIHDPINCTKMIKIEESWCEQACMDASSPVAAAGGLVAGDCHDTTFPTFLHVIVVGVFVKNSNSLATGASAGEYAAEEADCNSHTLVDGDVCEQMCIGEDHAHFAEKRGMTAGTCSTTDYTFLGEKRMKSFEATDSPETKEVAEENEIADATAKAQINADDQDDAKNGGTITNDNN